jgi:hypothetical protein
MRWHGVKKAPGVAGVLALAVMILASACTAQEARPGGGVTGVTSGSGLIGYPGGPVVDPYTLPLTRHSVSTGCTGSANPWCRDWPQFMVGSNRSAGRSYTQFWMIMYSTACPAGQHRNQLSFTGPSGIYCGKKQRRGRA